MAHFTSRVAVLSVASAAALASTLSLAVRPGHAQVDVTLPAFIRLQATTPGTAQIGHSNITGTSIAGQFVGSGGGLTNVNANLLDGLDSTAFLQGVPNPLSLSGSQVTSIISGTNSNTAAGAAGVKGAASALTGATNGLWGTSSSTSGRGVFGEATAASGVSFGGRFENSSTTGRGVYGLATSTTGNAYGVFGESQSSSGRGVLGLANATTGTSYGGYFDSDSVDGYGVFANSAGTYGLFASTTQTSGTAYGVYGETAAFNGVGVYGSSTSTSGSNYGGRFRAESTAGIGVSAAAVATSGSTFAGRFEANSTSGRGVFGWATAASGTTYGVWGQSDSPTGRGVYGKSTLGTAGYFIAGDGEALHAESTGAVGASFVTTSNASLSKAVFAQGGYYGGEFIGDIIGLTAKGSQSGLRGESIVANAEGVGVVGSSGSSDGIGVLGNGFGTNGTGVAGWTSVFRGVWGDAFNNSGSSAYGVMGEARSNPGRGVYGFASNSTGVGYGVRGVTSSSSGYGVYSVGDFGATGTKSFVIDHPFDPANKYLKHYSAEGPVPKNIYDGTVVTDATGWATVALPDYFMEINKDPRVQLTVNDSSDDFVMVKMVGELSGNTFRVRTSKPRVKVYWEVKATRNDAWVRAHGAPVEVLKDEFERGKYQHPELYGQPKEKGADYDPRIEAAKAIAAKKQVRTATSGG